MIGNVLNVTTQTFHSVQSVTDVVNLVLEAEVEGISIEALETEETAEVEEISTEALEIEETAEVEEISIEVLEIEIIPMMAIGIVQSVIIPILQDVLSVIDVASLVLEEEVVETAEVEGISTEVPEIEETVEAEEISIEALEIEETAEVVETVEAEEISIEVPEIEETAEVVETVEAEEISTEVLEMVEVEESEENSLTVTIIEKNPKRIISVNQGVKEQVMLTTMRQNL